MPGPVGVEGHGASLPSGFVLHELRRGGGLDDAVLDQLGLEQVERGQVALDPGPDRGRPSGRQP
jgi:hypothetical protein